MTSTVSTGAKKFKVVLKSELKAKQEVKAPKRPWALITLVTNGSAPTPVTSMFLVPTDTEGYAELKNYMERRDNNNMPDGHREKRSGLRANTGADYNSLLVAITGWMHGDVDLGFQLPRGVSLSVADLIPVGDVLSTVVMYNW